MASALISVFLRAGILSGMLACAGQGPSARAEPPVPAPAGPHQPEPDVPEMIPVFLPTVTFAMPGTRDSLQYMIDSVLAAPMWRNARWGILLVDAERGDTILSHDADRLFMPASNQKLLTAAVAFHTLGPDYRWFTPVMLRGVKRGGTFEGDILVSGQGDPSISDSLRSGRAASAFDPVIRALREHGITQITGRVLPWGDAFEGPTTGYGWALDDLNASYSAAVDELFYNEGELHIQVTAGNSAGAAVRAVSSPTQSYPRLRSIAHTVARGASIRRDDALKVAWDSVAESVVISGSMPAGSSRQFTISYRHPADAFLAALSEALSQSGIVVQHRVLRENANATPRDTLALIESSSFDSVLARMLKPSQNQIAELLFRSSGRAASGSGSIDSARAMTARQLLEWGITAEDAAYRDGSGLSRHDYLTPRTVVRVLDVMYRSPWYDVFRRALPVAGVDGTIEKRMIGTPAAGNVHAKTGTLDKARSLSGYVTSADGRLMLFSFLCNNYTVPTVEVERVQDMLAAMIAGGSFPELTDR